jgi:hypothetical protein
MILPRYPIYIPSKGRWENCMTANFLLQDGVPFKLVVEPQELEQYAARYGRENILVLPFSNLGQACIPARNWIKDHSRAAGDKRHWQLDDNMTSVMRMYHGKRIPCASGPAFAAVEDFSDRYTNVALSGMNYTMFIGLQPHREPAFLLNCRVYSCSLILNSTPNRWRIKWNDDVDMCLQLLADGWCTVLVNAFLVQKMQTMKVKGGNTSGYSDQDGRLKMARMAERIWPGVIETKRRFNRPQHVIKNAWRKFDTQLIYAPEFDPTRVKANEYGLQMQAVSKVKSPRLRTLLAKNTATNRKSK